MGDHQVRRLPVIDAERRLVGIVSLGDLAVETPQDAGTDVSEIVEELRTSAYLKDKLN